MRITFCVLCVATGSGIASAQDQQSASYFQQCINEAVQQHSHAAMPTFLSFKCAGATAQKLATRPDQCDSDAMPSLRNIERRSRRLEDGLYLRVVWRTEVCAGLCETRVYNDTRETSYSCEVRRHLEGRVAQFPPQQRSLGYYRRDDGYESTPRQGPAYYYYEPPVPEAGSQRVPEAPGERRITERYYYYIPGEYLQYRYPGREADDPRDNYRAGGARRDDDRRDDGERDADGRIHYYYR
jgi:hypothetical protein